MTYSHHEISRVQHFLKKYGVSSKVQELAPNGEYIRVTLPLHKIEKMFNAEFHNFHSESRDHSIHRSESYTVPKHLETVVTLINGINNFPVYHKNSKIVGMVPNTDGSVTPELIWKTYNMPNETDADNLADQAVFEALGQSFSPADLQQFQELYNIPQQPVKKVIGPNDPSACLSDPNQCGEANLDVQYIMAMAQGSPTVYWSIDKNIGDIFLDFIEAVAADPSPPQVYSISYGGPEGLQDHSNEFRFNTEACKMGLRGITLFASSGDDGVAGSGARGNPSACGFTPQYPANCPYVTIVGATMGPESGKAERACQSNTGSIITTGGGFSNLFDQPKWQKAAVSTYLNTANLPPSSMFNTTGRAYPDVAALGNAYHVILGGQNYQVSGTSASSPVFCAMVTLVNGLRERQNKSPLGFLNPLLYKLSSGIYNDITVGDNNCAAGQGSPTCCKYGFKCAPGWDPVTGLGSIDFTKFANALVQ